MPWTAESVERSVISDVADELDGGGAGVARETELVNDLGADSLSVVGLAMRIEDTFDVDVSDGEMEAVRTVGDLCALVARKLRERGQLA